MKLSQKAQHTLEYMILLTLIMAGIIIGGPYAIRSWNAQIKSWEDSTLDSFNDPLQEAPAGLVDIEGCNSTTWTASGCGLVTAPLDPCTATPRAIDNPPSEDSSTWTYKSSCAPGERLYTRTFNPNGCQCDPRYAPPPPAPTEPIAKCEVDSCCCDLRPLDVCVAENNGLNGAAVPACANIRNSRPLNPDGSCDNGYMKWAGTCGADPTTRYICVFDPNCSLQCNQPPTPQMNTGAYGAPCPGYDTNLPRRGIYYRFVNAGACDPNQKCQIQCKPGFEPSADGTACICPNGCTVTGTVDNPTCYCCPGRGCEAAERETDPVSGTTCSSRCPQDCGYCSPNCCGSGCPADSTGYVYPANTQYPFVMDFTWGGDQISDNPVTPPRGVVNPGDRIAYYSGYYHGDPFHCGFNKTTGMWLGFSSKFGFMNSTVTDPMELQNGQCRAVINSDDSAWSTGGHACRRYGLYNTGGFVWWPKRHCYMQNNVWGCFPFCGNTECDPGENCGNCPGDCACTGMTACVNGSCINTCGNNSCEATEDCNSCASDCGCAPPQTCQAIFAKTGSVWSCL